MLVEMETQSQDALARRFEVKTDFLFLPGLQPLASKRDDFISGFPEKCRCCLYGRHWILGSFMCFLTQQGSQVFFFFYQGWLGLGSGVRAGPVVLWSHRPCSEPLVLWSPGPLVPWSAHPLVSWSWSLVAALGRLRVLREVGKKQHVELLKRRD